MSKCSKEGGKKRVTRVRKWKLLNSRRDNHIFTTLYMHIYTYTHGFEGTNTSDSPNYDIYALSINYKNRSFVVALY